MPEAIMTTACMSPAAIRAAVEAAATREGGIDHVHPCIGYATVEDCVSEGYLWYNDDNHSTHVVKIQPVEVCSALNTLFAETC
jgi:hypothetical protein